MFRKGGLHSLLSVVARRHYYYERVEQNMWNACGVGAMRDDVKATETAMNICTLAHHRCTCKVQMFDMHAITDVHRSEYREIARRFFVVYCVKNAMICDG